MLRFWGILVCVCVGAIHWAEAQQPNEVSRRLGILADRIQQEAIETSDFATSIASFKNAEFKRMVVAESKQAPKTLNQTVIKQVEWGFKTPPTDRKPAELEIQKRLLAGGLNTASENVKAYAEYLRRLQRDVAGLSDQDALDKLQSVYVPPDVLIILDDGDEDSQKIVDRKRSSPITPFVITLGGGFTVDYPAVGAILTTSADDVLQVGCTGTLIAPNLVLTAAHCTVILADIKAVYFPHAGVFELARAPIVHDDFTPTLRLLPDADLAILVLAGPVTGIRPAKINDSRSVIDGIEGRIVGYGARKYYADQSSPAAGAVLGRADVLAASGLKIRARIRTSPCAGENTSRAICWLFKDTRKSGQEAFGTTCKGDSGGPLFVAIGSESILYGVTSGGDLQKPCASGSHAFDVNVEKFAPWIKKHIAELGTNPASALADNLDPTTNGDARFTLVGEYERFAGTRFEWEKSIDVQDNLEMLRVAVNSTMRGVRVGIEARDQGGSVQTLTCLPNSLGNVSFCEVRRPQQGKWTLVFRGDVDKEFQAVVTTFRKH